MKKLISTLFLLLLFINPILVKADTKSYEITKLIENAQILENGDVEVQEELTYTFKGDFNGIYRNLLKTGSSFYNISQIYLKDKNNNTIPMFESSSSEDNTYQLFDNPDKYEVKLFSKSSNEEKNFVIHYTIHNAVVKQVDFGELNWKFYTVENSIPIKNAQLNLSLKSSTFDLDKFKYWPFVEGEGFTTNYDENGIHIKGTDLTSILGLKIIFQPEFLKTSPLEDSNLTYTTGTTPNSYEIVMDKPNNHYLGVIAPNLIILIFVIFFIYVFTKKNKKFQEALNKYRSTFNFF